MSSVSQSVSVAESRVALMYLGLLHTEGAESGVHVDGARGLIEILLKSELYGTASGSRRR